MDALELDGRVVSADTDKASALAPVFFPSLPPVSDQRQAEIDHTWSTHRPSGVPGSVEVLIAEVVSAVRHMRPQPALGLDDIPVSILKENLYIIAPWLALIYTASLSLHYFPVEMDTEFLNAVRVRPCSFYTTGSVRPFPCFSLGGEYVYLSYGPLKFLKSAKLGRKFVRPLIKELRNPFLPKFFKKFLNYGRCNI